MATDKIRDRNLDLVSNAYKSISVKDMSNFVGMSESEAVHGAESNTCRLIFISSRAACTLRSWKFDRAAGIVYPEEDATLSSRTTGIHLAICANYA